MSTQTLLVIFFALDVVSQLCVIYLLEKILETVYGNTVGEARSIFFLVNIDRDRKERVTNMFLPVTKKLPLSLDILDAKGNPAKVDGAPAWALTDPTFGALEVAEDGDLGEGVKQILGELDVEVLGGEAVVVAIKAGEPVDA